MDRRCPSPYDVSKRIFDLAVALPALVVLAPVFVVIAISIKFDSTGPLLYRGVRSGQYGKSFMILKFRTMITNADLLSTTTGLNDPRVTRVGRMLRACKLDEIPQLLNVVRGEMSLVGPRPEVEEHTREYSEEERLILSVRPGITDYSSIRFVNLAEVLGAEDPHQVFITRIRAEKNRLRVAYVQNRSFCEDLRIIVRTIEVIVRNVSRQIRGYSWNT